MPIRVLVVDDSLVIRKLIAEELTKDANILTESAADGVLALEKVDSFRPQIIILDLEMPRLDGFGVLRELRKRNCRLPVVVFSTLSERGAKATLEALALGATDYLCKPTSIGLDRSRELLREQLLPKIAALSAVNATASSAPSVGGSSVNPAVNTKLRQGSIAPVEILVIGISTGGPAALSQIFQRFTAPLSVPMLIVQHMPPVFTKMFAQRLGDLSRLVVREAEHGELLSPGTVLVAPGDHHVTLVGSGRDAVRVSLDKGAQENGCRPAIDPLFRSVASIYGSGALALVMTGLGSDGTKGAAAVVEAGGSVWAQDEATSAIWSMPGSVVRAGLACRVFPLDSLPAELSKRLGDSAARGRIS